MIQMQGSHTVEKRDDYLREFSRRPPFMNRLWRDGKLLRKFTAGSNVSKKCICIFTVQVLDMDMYDINIFTKNSTQILKKGNFFTVVHFTDGIIIFYD